MNPGIRSRSSVVAGRGAMAGVLAAVASVTMSSRAGAACEPVRVVTDAKSLPEPWRRALEALVEATGREGQPWSCAAGVLSVAVWPAGDATIRLEEVGRPPVERHVSVPAHLVSTAQALVAVPSPMGGAVSMGRPESPPKPPGGPRRDDRAAGAGSPENPPQPPVSTAAPGSAAAHPLRVVIDTLFVFRYATPSPAAWVGGELRGSVPLGEWSVGAGVRYDMLLAFTRSAPDADSMSEVAFGLSAGRRLLKAPFELYATLDPRLAVVVFEARTATDRMAGAQTDFRLGTSLRAASRIADNARWVVAIDAEVTPSAVGGEQHAAAASHALPAFGVGLALGLEAAVP